ncbi:MAG: putative endopeptidase, partial [Sediminicola sp.]
MKLISLKLGLAMIVLASMILACKNDRGIILSNMDPAVSPQEDFYNYVNGNWMKTTEIPDDQVRWGGFGVLSKSTAADVLKILEKAKESGKYAAESDQGKALLIFASELDTIARNAAGINPLKPALAKIASIINISDFQKVMTENAAAVSQPFIGVAAFSNPSNSSMNSAYITPGALGLPDRDFYTNTDIKSVEIRGQYVDHITRMLQFLGDSEADARTQAEVVLAFETKLATPRLDKVGSRDFRNFNNPRSMAEIQEMVPSIQWEKAFIDMGVTNKLDTVIVMQPAYMDVVQNIFDEGDVARWKTVMRWATLNDAAGQLTTEIDKENWGFYSKTLNGSVAQKQANKRALRTVNRSVGEALGKLYVDEMFPPDAKEKAENMISNIIEAYKARIMAIDWMGESTKIKAIEKLDKLTVKIGYPNKWKNYSTLDVKARNTFYDNMIAVRAWGLKKNLDDINELVDLTEWGMPPQTVNASFNPFNNEILFPAAILQPPFYDYLADDAVNYGGIGAVIGHEISHAFDDSGSRFDANGNLVNWWSETDLTNFTERGNALVQQYDAIEVLDSVFVNGKFTLGENIGDLGGVLAAYDGLQRLYKEIGRPEDIDGLTAEQRFF